MGRPLSNWERTQRQRERERERENAAHARERERAHARTDRERERAQLAAEKARGRAQARREREAEQERVQRAKEEQIDEWKEEVARFRKHLASLTGWHRRPFEFARWQADFEARCQPLPFTGTDFFRDHFRDTWTPNTFPPAVFRPEPYEAYEFAPLDYLKSKHHRPEAFANLCLLVICLALALGLYQLLEATGTAVAASVSAVAWIAIRLTYRPQLRARHEADERVRQAQEQDAEEQRRASFEASEAARRRAFDADELQRKATFVSGEASRHERFLQRRADFTERENLREELQTATEQRNERSFRFLDDQRLDTLQDIRDGAPSAIDLLCSAVLPMQLKLEHEDEFGDGSIGDLEVGFRAREGKLLEVALIVPPSSIVPDRVVDMTPSQTKIKYSKYAERARLETYHELVCSLALRHAIHVFKHCPALENIQLECSVRATDAATGEAAEPVLLRGTCPRDALAAVNLREADAFAALESFGFESAPFGGKQQGRLKSGFDRDELIWTTVSKSDDGAPVGLAPWDKLPERPNPYMQADPKLDIGVPSRPIVVGPEEKLKTLGEALAQALPGARIVLRPGRYTGPATIKWPVTIEGEGSAEQVVLTCRNGPALIVKEGWHVRVNHLTVLCTQLPQQQPDPEALSSSAVELVEGELLLRQCILQSTAGSGVSISDPAGKLVVNECTLSSSREAGVACRAGETTVEGSQLTGNVVAGVLVAGEAHVRVTRSQATGNRGTGVHLLPLGSATVDSCDLRGNGAGSWSVGAASKLTAYGNQGDPIPEEEASDETSDEPEPITVTGAPEAVPQWTAGSPAPVAQKSEAPARASNDKREHVAWNIEATLQRLDERFSPQLKRASSKVDFDEALQCGHLEISFSHRVWTEPDNDLFVYVGPRDDGHCAWLFTPRTWVAERAARTGIQTPFEAKLAALVRASPAARALGIAAAAPGERYALPLPDAAGAAFLDAATTLLPRWIEVFRPAFEEAWDALPRWAQLVETGENAPIRALLRSVAKDAQKDFHFIALLGDALAADGRYQEANSWFERLDTQFPQFPDGPWGLARVASLNEEYETCSQHAAEALSRKGGRELPANLELAAISAYKLKDCEGALRLFQELEELEPDRPGLLNWEAYMLDRLGRTAEAEPVYRRSIEAGRDGHYPIHNLAKLLRHRGARDEAIAFLRRDAKADGTLYSRSKNAIDKIKSSKSGDSASEAAADGGGGTLSRRPPSRSGGQSSTPPSLSSQPGSTLDAAGPAALPPGTRVNNYIVERRLGTGGMATVYKVRHAILGSFHALKVLSLELVGDERLRMRFLSEGQIQARLKHPNLVSVTDLVAEPGIAALVMDYVDGHTLEDEIRSRPEPADADFVREVFRQVLAGVGYIHEHNIVHRDLKPSNIMLQSQPGGAVLARIMDFGIAKQTGSEAVEKAATRTGATMGTVMYMSPEQIRSARDVTPRSDIFSLGVTLYELATGQMPFDGGSDFETQLRIVQGNFVAPEQAFAGIDSGLARVIKTAMAVQPEDRFESCEAFAAALLETRRSAVRAG